MHQKFENFFIVIVGSNSVYRNFTALQASVNDHYLALFLIAVFIEPLFFKGQADRFHVAMAGGFSIPRNFIIYMKRPEAVWTVVTVVSSNRVGKIDPFFAVSARKSALSFFYYVLFSFVVHDFIIASFLRITRPGVTQGGLCSLVAVAGIERATLLETHGF